MGMTKGVKFWASRPGTNRADLGTTALVLSSLIVSSLLESCFCSFLFTTEALFISLVKLPLEGESNLCKVLIFDSFLFLQHTLILLEMGEVFLFWVTTHSVF